MVLICGIEEAGRGPVIGPMVMCGLCIDEKDEQILKDIGAKDSKMLSPLQRERLFDRLLEAAVKVKIVIIQPHEIDAALNDPDMNLNLLESKTTALILDELKPAKAILDCPSNNIEAYTDSVYEFLGNKDIKIISEHKADVNYPVVSAASIIAKVTRDREIEKLKIKMGVDFGSGYPSDPKTVEFLEKNWKMNLPIFRKTWASYKRYADGKKQKRLGEF
jgi:ribonuclease HII